MKKIRAGLAAICILSLCTAGCAGEAQPDENSSQKQENTEGQEPSASLYASAEQAAGYCRDIYEANSDTESLEKNRALVERLGEHGCSSGYRKSAEYDERHPGRGVLRFRVGGRGR